MKRFSPILLLLLVAVFVTGCGGPVLANPAAAHPVVTPPTPTSPRPADPVPIVLPDDDAPHDRLTEWWYDTGHLRAADGRRFGFELVVFRAERGGFPVSWASHLALTDETGQAFHYAQRSEIGPQVDRSPREGDAPLEYSFVVEGGGRTPWTMAGGDGRDELHAAATGDEVGGDPVSGFGIDLRLTARKPAALHGGDGWIDFGPAGGSYYYSRTDMAATGTVTLGDETLAVEGDAWFDHQWGDFISVGGGGWDWFAVNLDDGTDLTLSLVRAADGTYPLVYGTLVDRGRNHDGPRRGRVHRGRHRPLDEPGDRGDLPRGLARPDPSAGAGHRPPADRRAAGAGYAGDDRRRVLGGFAGRGGDPRRVTAGWRGLRRADRLREPLA